MMISKKKSLWIAAFLLVALIGASYVFQKDGAEAKKDQEIVVASRGSIEDVVTAQGTLEPKDYVDVGAQVSGQIKKLYVDIGDVVKTGDLLAEIDPKTYESIKQADQARLDSLQAQLLQQQAQTDYDRLQFQRAQKLTVSKAISQGDFEEKEKILKVAEATILSLQAQISEAKATLEKDMINLGYTKIFAPMDGVVSDRKAREGQTLNANQTTPTILQLANLKVMTIRAEIAEADVMRLKPDMEATFTTMGGERKWKGKIRQILPTPEVVNDVVLYNALIDVENEDGQLMNGMSTQVSFVIARADNVVTLPVRALGLLVSDRDSTKSKTYRIQLVGEGNKPTERNVIVGLMTRAKAEIVSGLQDGDRVIVSSSGAPEPKKRSGTGMPPGMGARL